MSQEEANGIARAVERARRSRRTGLKFALPTVAALGAGTALAVAIPGGDGTITGCYVTVVPPAGAPTGPRYGSLRVIDPGASPNLPAVQRSCESDEATISWNQSGPPGPQGPAGPAGAAGRSLVGQTSFGFGKSGQTFLKIEGIKGESHDKVHKDQIDVLSFSLGTGGGGSGATGGGGGAGKVSFQSFTITKKLDKSSPLLFQAAGSGKHIKLATLSFSKKVKGKQQDYLQFKFTDVLISSLQAGQSPKGTPQEVLTLNFHKASESFLGTNHKVLQTVSITISGNKVA